ncbi:NUDIX hydrolase [Shewanella yunxiaonensis]|uniref:Phosphatase NudJ n=1 Tax=Shewanella yunxiaonensis TaxID=2829809 RepID=A0ABX7YPE0_9GAMM|nr:NUDIX hydrolase [Shewanella yunxiaonensis]QUN04577.1 NUDIX hydrolase [Shewanella yunxiaonensis]
MSNIAVRDKVRYRPNVTVACVIEAENKFLMVEEWINGEQKFNQPAGHLEAGESLTMACAREIIEETGLALQPQQLLRIDQYNANAELAFLRFTFCCQLPACHSAAPQDADITATHWLSFDEICALGSKLRSPLVAEVIRSYRQGPRYDLELLNWQFLALAGGVKP